MEGVWRIVTVYFHVLNALEVLMCFEIENPVAHSK